MESSEAERPLSESWFRKMEKDSRKVCREKRMAFQQAQIPVQKRDEFDELKSAIERAFAVDSVESLLRKMQSSDVRVRQFEKALGEKVFEAVDPVLAKSGKTAQGLYGALALSDQALMREFYLERVENVDPKIRGRFQKVYQYY